MLDKLGYLQESVTKTASFNSAAYDLRVGTPLGGFYARVGYTAASVATNTSSLVFSIEHSDDNSTWYAHTSGAADAVTLTTTAKSGEIFLPIKTQKRYIRLVATLTQGTGTTPTFTYESQISLTPR